MIDTDKYEGHTPAPWDGILSGYFTIEELKKIDKTLMQDAPIILEAYKRLRKDRDLLWDAIRLSGTGGHQEEEIAFWYEKLLNMNEAELKEAFKGHYEDD